MYQLDKQERAILKQLIKNPRISDNQIAIKANVPLKTVNRKRKILEEQGLVSYYCSLDTSALGTGTFEARSLYITILNEGITRKRLTDMMGAVQKKKEFFAKHLSITMVGEYEGNVALINLVESRKNDDLIEIHNAEIVPELELAFGKGCIKKTVTLPIASITRLLHNYLPQENITKGKIDSNWPDAALFVDE